MFKIIHTADIHGNEIQYSKLVDYAIKSKVNAIIISGDIAPKHFSGNNYIAGQRNFLEHRLPELLNPLKESDMLIYIIMGNDDCSVNMDVLEKQANLYHIIHDKRVRLTNEFDIIGYSFVPITPFGIKDWEKFDFSNVPENFANDYMRRKMTNYRLSGNKSTLSGWNAFQFTPETEKEESIQKDLGQNKFLKNPNRTVYVMHGPPNNTNLDMILNRNHVGSFAIREFIEKHQPYLTLHGHIHETVDVSGSWKDNIKKTICMAPGNHNENNKLAIIEFDLYNPDKAKRIIL